jgi:hypothetical protein
MQYLCPSARYDSTTTVNSRHFILSVNKWAKGHNGIHILGLLFIEYLLEIQSVVIQQRVIYFHHHSVHVCMNVFMHVCKYACV